MKGDREVMASSKGARSIVLLAVTAALVAAIAAGTAGPAAAQKRQAVPVRTAAKLKVTENDKESRETVAVGSGTGTFAGKVHLRVHVINGSKLSARFVSLGHKGTLVGTGAARYSVSGSILRFFGSLKVTGGTGGYSNARGHGIEIEGVLNRLKERITMTLNGRISL